MSDPMKAEIQISRKQTKRLQELFNL